MSGAEIAREADAVAGIVAAASHLPSATVLGVVVIAAFGFVAYGRKLSKRSNETALIDSQEQQGNALIRIVEGMVEEGQRSASGQRAATEDNTAAITELRITMAAQTALIGNLVQAISHMGADVADANDRCNACKRKDYQ